MARAKPTVRWNGAKQRWMAWVTFPDGSRKKVERADKADAAQDLDELLVEQDKARAPGHRRQRLVTFDEVLDDWVAAGCPKAAVSKNSRRARKKSPNTLTTIGYLLDGHVSPEIGKLRVDRTDCERVEALFQKMADNDYATSTIDHTWVYLNQACLHALRKKLITTNPAADVLLPEARPAKKRKSFTLDQVQTLLTAAIPADTRPALWITGLMCGLRPGELSGLRWPYVDIDSDEPCIVIGERANEINKRYAGQAEPKTSRKGGVGLHPLVVAALRRHQSDLEILGLYDPDGFVFPTRNGTAIALANLRRDFKRLCHRAKIDDANDWTTYELRHSFASLVSDQLDDLDLRRIGNDVRPDRHLAAGPGRPAPSLRSRLPGPHRSDRKAGRVARGRDRHMDPDVDIDQRRRRRPAAHHQTDPGPPRRRGSPSRRHRLTTHGGDVVALVRPPGGRILSTRSRGSCVRAPRRTSSRAPALHLVGGGAIG